MKVIFANILFVLKNICKNKIFYMQIFSIKYFLLFCMTSKIFQVNYQNRWLNTGAASAKDSVTGPLELAIKVVALATRLQTITVKEVSLMTGPPTPVDKSSSSITRPPALVVMWRLQPSNHQHQSPKQSFRTLGGAKTPDHHHQ